MQFAPREARYLHSFVFICGFNVGLACTHPVRMSAVVTPPLFVCRKLRNGRIVWRANASKQIFTIH
jgi:hypothetical protein